MKFNNETLIITDPCYVIPDEIYHNWLNSDVFDDNCDYEHESVINGVEFIWSGTIYGDWSCTTFDANTEEVLGHFCADAGLVAVFKYEDVLKLCPNFFNEYREHCYTKINNYTGDVSIEVVPLKEETINDEGDSDSYDYEEVRVIGQGIIDFYTTQTGL